MLAIAVLYVLGAIRLWATGRHWPILRALSFVSGAGAAWFVTALGINAAATELISALVFQQFTLIVVASPLLLMGSPGRLLLRAMPHSGLGGWVLRCALGLYRSLFARTALHPLVAPTVALIVFPLLYFTDLVSTVMRVPGGHVALLTVWLMLGVIAGAPLWSSDPMPRTPSFAARLIDILFEIQLHAIFGLILLSAGAPLFLAYASEPAAWGIDRLLDQEIAGTLAWTYGELPLFLVLLVTLAKWRRRDERRSASRNAEDDQELEAYNRYLAAQRAEDERSRDV